MLRIHFTAADLMLTRFVAKPPPQAELAIALMVLRQPGADLFDHWRRCVWRRFPRQARPLLDLVHTNWSPDFLDDLSPDPEQAHENVLATPAAQLRYGLDQLIAHGHPVTPWLRELADGDPDARAMLADALRGAHDMVFGDAWPRVAGAFQADLAYRNQLLLREGVGPTLTRLFPGSRWRGATLELDFALDYDLYLTGDGVTLTPSVFRTSHRPLVGGVAPGQPRLLVYSARIPLPLIGGADGDGPELPVAKLLGRTRAAVLEAITVGESTSTGALAHRLGISPGRASEHATVLRQAGLITSHRHRNTVLHAATPLGTELLNGAVGR